MDAGSRSSSSFILISFIKNYCIPYLLLKLLNAPFYLDSEQMKKSVSEMRTNGIICIFRSSLVATRAQSFATSCVRRSNNGKKNNNNQQKKNILSKHYIREESQLRDPHMLYGKYAVTKEYAPFVFHLIHI